MRVKVGKFVVRHNKVEYGEGDVFELKTKEAERLLNKGIVSETSQPVTSRDKAEKSAGTDEVAIGDLTVEYVKGLTQKDLVVLKKRLELETADNKAVTLIPAIIEAIGGEDDVNLDTMDEAALRVLAEEEEVDLPEDADIEQIRNILETALGE